MDICVLLNYVMGILFFVALFFVVRLGTMLEQRIGYSHRLERENAYLNDSLTEAVKQAHVRRS